MRMMRAVLTVGGFTALSRVFGLIREILLSHFLGASGVTDAFFVAFKFPNFFRRLFAEGAFNAAFVPMFSRQLASEGADAARETAEQVFAVLMGVLMVFVVFVILFTPTIIHILAPGFSTTPDRQEMAITFIRITFSYILFISLAAHLSGVLNAVDRFAAAAGVPIILNMTMIGALLCVPHFSHINPGILLSLSVAVAGVLQFIWLYIACARAGFRMHLRRPQLTPQVKTLLRLMVPGMIGAGVMNINFFIDTIIASYLPEKSVSFLYYADRLNQLPLSVFGIAIGTALLPALSRHLRSGDFDIAQQHQSIAVEFAIQVALPAAVGLVVMAHPIINVIYGLGDADNGATAQALSAFALGIPAYVLTKIFAVAFFARQDTKTPVIIGSICIMVNLALNILLMGPLLHVGLALATSISAWLNAGFLYLVLHQRAWYTMDKKIPIIFIKVIGCCMVMALAIFVLDLTIGGLEIRGIGAKIMYLGSIVLVGIIVFLTAGRLLGAFNIAMIRQALKGAK